LPTPAKTSIDDIVAAGRRILEAERLDGLTLQRVAKEVGVQAPSLYKRIGGRGDLIRRISNDAASELGAMVDAAAGSGDAEADVRAMAHAARAFARAHPQAYTLLFAQVPDAWRVDQDVNSRISAGVIGVAGDLAHPADAMLAARLVVAWLHGFLSMELAGAFRLGGDIDAAFEFGIDRILAGLHQIPLPSEASDQATSSAAEPRVQRRSLSGPSSSASRSCRHRDGPQR